MTPARSRLSCRDARRRRKRVDPSYPGARPMWRDSLSPMNLPEAADLDGLLKLRGIVARVGEVVGIA